MTWLEEIVQAFQLLGGKAYLTDLYVQIEKSTQRKLATNWKPVVRSIIEDHSADAAFRAKKDIFYSVGGKGSGYWGLRNWPKQEVFHYIPADTTLLPEQVINSEQYYEGATKQITVNTYERNAEARKVCLQHHGTDCSACGFNFKSVYGDVGTNFIHVHHLKPLSKIGKEYQLNPIEDLKPICPNCHAIIHRRTPPYSIEEVREMLSKYR